MAFDSKQKIKDILDRECYDRNKQGIKCEFYMEQPAFNMAPCFNCHEHDKLTAEILDAVNGVVYA